MKRFYITCSVVMLFSTILTPQSIIGKLIDLNGNALAGLHLAMYSSASVYQSVSDTDGSFIFNTITDIKDEELPTGYEVSANYPNPFNPRTRINITLLSAGEVRAEVFNFAGQKVCRDINKSLNAGNNYFDVELNGLPNGIYIGRITIDEKHTIYKKLMLLYGSQHLKTIGGSSIIPAETNIRRQKTFTAISIDSIIVSGTIIYDQVFKNLPQLQEATLDLGNMTIEYLKAITCPGVPTVTYEGKTYTTVQIRSQCWLKENLDIGTQINGNTTQTNNGTIEKYCFNDDPNNCANYGALYQWAEMVQYENGAGIYNGPNPPFTRNVQGICPSGWHVPTFGEFQILTASIKSDGNSLKEIGQGVGSGAGTNTSGFSALLCGCSEFTVNYRYMDEYAFFLVH